MSTLPFQARGAPFALALADAMALAAAGVTAAAVRFPASMLGEELRTLASHPGFLAYALVALWALAITFDLYDAGVWRTRIGLALRVAALGVTLPVALALGVYMAPSWRFGRGLLALTVAGTLLGVWLIRVVAERPDSAPRQRAVLVGDGPIIETLMGELAGLPSAPFAVIGHLSGEQLDSDPGLLDSGLAAADLVILAQIRSDPMADEAISLNFRGIPVVDAAGAYAAITGRIPILQVDSRWFVATGDFSALATTPFHRVQRLLDVFAASLLSLLALPFLLVGALAVVLNDGLPVFYRQQRLGRFRKPFTLLKLRTMKRSAEDQGPRFAAPADTRVHPVGRLLRRWRLDELPQLWNVLRGDMSLVGPRPERPELAVDLEQGVPFYAYRYSVRPGLTGWAQVHLPYCADPEDHQVKVEYDLYYLRHHGPGMYAHVLMRTLGALVFRPGR